MSEVVIFLVSFLVCYPVGFFIGFWLIDLISNWNPDEGLYIDFSDGKPLTNKEYKK